MIGVEVRVTGHSGIARAVKDMAGRAKDPRMALEKCGRDYVGNEQPRIFAEGGPPGQKWKRVIRDGRSADPLMDVGTLQKSSQFKADKDLVVGVPAASPAGVYARLHQMGGSLKPKKKFGLFPLSPPLSPSERRAVSREGGFRALFPDAFFLFKGPEGTGLYRKTRRAVIGYSRTGKVKPVYGKGPGIEMIAMAWRSLTIAARPFLVWTARFLARTEKALREWAIRGRA